MGVGKEGKGVVAWWWVVVVVATIGGSVFPTTDTLALTFNCKCTFSLVNIYTRASVKRCRTGDMSVVAAKRK